MCRFPSVTAVYLLQISSGILLLYLLQILVSLLQISSGSWQYVSIFTEDYLRQAVRTLFAE